MDRIIIYQKEVLKALSGRVNKFYLAGGTALSLFYFRHRLSVDLDFFSQDFSYSAIERIAEYLEGALKKKVELKGQNLGGKIAKMAVYSVHFTAKDSLKIDFVEDTVKLLAKTNMVDGINVLSLEDIYLRKLYALAGMVKTLDDAGRESFTGGRADAKDLYDVYFLSHTFMPLSKFTVKYCNRIMREAVIKWFRTYDRMAMTDGLLGLKTNQAADYRAIEKHFKKETDAILDHELGGL